MTKKDYEIIASVFHDAVEIADSIGRTVLHGFAERMADKLQREYNGGYAFNRTKFLQACGF